MHAKARTASRTTKDPICVPVDRHRQATAEWPTVQKTTRKEIDVDGKINLALNNTVKKPNTHHFYGCCCWIDSKITKTVRLATTADGRKT